MIGVSRRAGVAALACTLAVAGAFTLVTRASGTTPTKAGSSAITVRIGLTGCGTGWSKPRAGDEDFVLDNSDIHAADVQLVDARSGAVYAELEPLGSGTTAHLRIRLGNGTYAFRCVMDDDNSVTGPPVTITGADGVNAAAQPVAAVTQNDLVPYVLKYEAYVTARLPQLRTQVAALRGAIDAGDLAAARTAWLPAHLTYEQLGAAYGAFGDADNEINGTADGLPHGVQDSGFTGFHRIEYGLWHGESAASLTAPANGLLAAVTALGPQFARAQIDPLEVSIRAHEITENALEFELTGRTDYGSHSNLATIDANLAGTREVLTVLQPLLAPRYPALPRATAELAQTEAQLAATEHAGDYPPLSSLSQPQRERLDSDLSELTELLAPVAAILEPRRTTS